MTAAIGSNHLSYDLARALAAPLAEAERIKKNCAILGTAHPLPGDTTVDLIAYQAGGDDPAGAVPASAKQVTRAHISTILTSRIGALLQHVQHGLEPLGLAPQRFGEVVLTGGGSALGGLAAEAARVFGLPARVGVPTTEGWLPQPLRHAAFATAAGLATIARTPGLGFHFGNIPAVPMHVPRSDSGSSWARQSF